MSSLMQGQAVARTVSTNAFSRALRRGSRARVAEAGITLIEALIAFVVMGLGMLAVVNVQGTLRFNSDIAKQRSEAVRIAQYDVENLRSFSVLAPVAGRAAYDDILGGTPVPVVGPTTNATYTVVRSVTDLTAPDFKSVQVVVSWEDRRGTTPAPSVTVNTLVAGIDPALSGMLSIAPNGSPLKNPLARVASIPLLAVDLGDGRSAIKGSESGTVAWTFNNLSGVITSRCTVGAGTSTSSLTAADLTVCTSISGRLLNGFVRFSTAAVVTAADAENPLSLALDLNMAMSGLSAGASIECFDNGASVVGTLAPLSYLCAVSPPNGNDPWSGQLRVSPVGWVLGRAVTQYRLCRYSADYNGSGSVSNDEHPATYSAVTANLTNQNFLVVRGDNNCPTDVAADPASGDIVNSNTAQVLP